MILAWNYVCKSEVGIFAFGINYIGCLYEFNNDDDEIVNFEMIWQTDPARLLRNLGKTGILYVTYFESKCLMPPGFKNFVVI